MTFKKLSPLETVFHHFEIDVTTFALYDSELDMPIVYGSRNLVDATIRHLNPRVTIIYYKKDIDRVSYKRKIKYEGKKIVAKNSTATPATIK